MRKFLVLASCLLAMPLSLLAAPLRVALLDFEDNTGSKPDLLLGGAVDSRALAAKGLDTLSRQLLATNDFVLIDRRDFVAKLVAPQGKDLTEPRPGFIQAAQLLGADAVLSGSLASFSTRKEKQSQAGYSAEFTKLNLRVTLRALDVVDGSVIAVVDGTAEQDFRQTDAVQTQIGEEDVLQMLDKALSQAVPGMAKALADRQASNQKPRVKINVDTTENPALVEIDGVLVGSSPLVGLDVYQGDHTLAVSRPGYVSMAKRIVLDRDFQINVPMFRTDLSAEERKAILEKADMKAYITNGKPDFLIQEMGP